MIERIVYTPEAEQDVVEAYAWYETGSEAWGRISFAASRCGC
jgi:hypothetical protein